MTTLRPPRAPSTRGLLSANSLGELLVFALEERLQGSFVFETIEGQKSALFVDAGQVIKARTEVPVEPLGRLLAEARLIDTATLDAGLVQAGLTGHLLGEVLVELAAVSAEQVEAALGEQLGRRVSLIGRLPGSSAYGFYADRDFLGGWPLCDADPLALIWRSVRDASGWTPRQKEFLTSLTGRKLRLHPACAPERLGLSQQEQIVVNALRTRPRAIEELLRAGLLDGERLQRLMYTLALTQQIEQGPQLLPLDAAANLRRSSRPPLGSYASLPPPRPASASPGRAPASLGRASLAPGHASVPPSSASVAPGRGSPSGMASSLPPRSPSSLHPLVGDRRTGTGSVHPTDPGLLASARASYDAARELVQRQQFEAAEKLARKASAEDTGNAEYLALHAWLRAQLGELQKPELAAQIVAALDRAAWKQRESVSIRFYRGQVLSRLGRDEEALRDFRFVLRREPDHVDAARELRLQQMRRRSAEKRPSLLAKLFLR
jgi:tetratricopeptide (TPR) repeat protein